MMGFRVLNLSNKQSNTDLGLKLACFCPEGLSSFLQQPFELRHFIASHSYT